MSWFSDSANHRPLRYWKEYPVWMVSYLAVAGIISLVLTAVFGQSWVQNLSFSTDLATTGQFWTPLTYVWVNPPSVFFVASTYFFMNFGGEVERHLGRRSVVWMLISSRLLVPALLSAVQLLLGISGQTFGLGQLMFSCFIAFATLYPNAIINLILCSIRAWIAGVIFVSIGFLSAVMNRSIPDVVNVLAPAAVAYFWVRYQTGRLTFQLPASWKRKRLPRRDAPEIEVDLSKPMEHRYHRPPTDEEVINAILDKISTQGMHSLNAEEKAILERRSRVQQRRREK
jgi:hypothetical protein